jgi:pyridoxal phosphate enzyme (YggS family)
VPAERLVAAVAAGLTILGENRVQEAEAKVATVGGATWHLIGPLQSNKAKRALATFAVIESVDTVELAERLDRLAAEHRPGGRVPVLLQVNVDDDPAKAGFSPDGLVAALPRLAGLEHLELGGLMTVGRLVERAEDARPTFAALRTLSERLRGSDAGGAGRSGLGPALSMGMTGDYPIAVEEGATIVRVGRALFGERHHH